jgi:hypothetical protein
VGYKLKHAPLREHIEVPCSIQEPELRRPELHDAHDVCHGVVHGVVHSVVHGVVHGVVHRLPVLRGVTHDGSSQAGVPRQHEHGTVAAIAHGETPSVHAPEYELRGLQC